MITQKVSPVGWLRTKLMTMPASSLALYGSSSASSILLGHSSQVGVGRRGVVAVRVNDHIFLRLNGLVVQVLLQHALNSGRISCLRVQRGATDVRGHGVSRHQSPGMSSRRRLWEPHISGIATDMATVHGIRQCVLVHNLS